MNKAIFVFIVLVGLVACSTTQKQSAKEKQQSAADINAQLAYGYISQGDKKQGVAKLRKALSLKPALPSTYHYIAESYRLLGQPELAETAYLKAIKLAPRDSAMQNNYGVFLCEQGRYKEAENRFMISARNPLYATPEEAYENAALCALRMPDVKRAEYYFRKALEVNPLRVRSLYRLAHIEFEQKNYMQARAFLQRYFGLADATPEALWLGIQIERYNDNQMMIKKYARTLMDKFPESQEARWYLESKKT